VDRSPSSGDVDRAHQQIRRCGLGAGTAPTSLGRHVSRRRRYQRGQYSTGRAVRWWGRRLDAPGEPLPVALTRPTGDIWRRYSRPGVGSAYPHRDRSPNLTFGGWRSASGCQSRCVPAFRPSRAVQTLRSPRGPCWWSCEPDPSDSPSPWGGRRCATPLRLVPSPAPAGPTRWSSASPVQPGPCSHRGPHGEDSEPTAAVSCAHVPSGQVGGRPQPAAAIPLKRVPTAGCGFYLMPPARP